MSSDLPTGGDFITLSAQYRYFVTGDTGSLGGGSYEITTTAYPDADGGINEVWNNAITNAVNSIKAEIEAAAPNATIEFGRTVAAEHRITYQ